MVSVAPCVLLCILKSLEVADERSDTFLLNEVLSAARNVSWGSCCPVAFSLARSRVLEWDSPLRIDIKQELADV